MRFTVSLHLWICCRATQAWHQQIDDIYFPLTQRTRHGEHYEAERTKANHDIS